MPPNHSVAMGKSFLFFRPYLERSVGMTFWGLSPDVLYGTVERAVDLESEDLGF